MLDNELITIIIGIINANKTAVGIGSVSVKQNFQPTAQGANSDPTVYLSKISDQRYGWPQRKDEWDPDDEVMVHTETQQYQTMFQIEALVTQNPSTPDVMTAADVLNRIAYILQSAKTIAQLEAQGIGILRVTDIRNSYFQNDREQFQAAPSFDFTLTHKMIITSEEPAVETVEFQILRV